MVFDILYSDLSPELKIIIFVCVLAVVVMSISFHEFAHAFVAYKCGDSTAKINGRMTLNPFKHIDVLGFLMFALLGFGFAKAVPINPYNFKKQRRDYFLVSIAGITVNLILAVVAAFFYVLIINVMAESLIAIILLYFFQYLLLLNIGMMIFNLLPIFPLDGFRIVEAASGRANKFVNFMRRYGSYILIGLLIWSLVLGWIMNIAPGAAYILQYFDILGFTLGFLIKNVSYGLTWLWGLLF